MKRSLTCLALLALSTVLAACDDGSIGSGDAEENATGGAPSGTGGGGPLGPGLEPANWDTVKSDVERATPAATLTDLQEFSRGNHQLAFDLYGEVTGDSDDNVLISPTSIRTAFAMAYAGAKGDTAAEMETVLHYPPGDATHDAFNALDLAFESRNLPATDDEDPVELSVVNSFWSQNGYPWLNSYLDTLGTYYGSGVESVDFASAPEECRELINLWVEDATRERIQDLLPEGSISHLTVAVLVNAVYFKAPWEQAFEEANTHAGTFYGLDGSEATADFMPQDKSIGYAAGEGYQAAELAFRGGDLAMVFIVPDAGTFADFEAALDADRYEQIIADLEPTTVGLEVPKFEFEFSVRLKAPLQALGMSVPFTSAADFSGMLESGNIWIDEAYHKTFIAIDEKGAEAAAATAIVMRGDSIVVPDVELTIDRPFFVGIRDVPTNNLLFFGRVLDPTA